MRFTTHEQAMILRELGFNEFCYESSFNGSRVPKHSPGLSKNDEITREGMCTLPLISQAFDFFRAKYDFDVYVKSEYKNTIKVGYYFVADDFYSEPYKTYKEAELACLDKLIELVKN